MAFSVHVLIVCTIFGQAWGLQCYRCVYTEGSLASLPGLTLGDYSGNTGLACKDPEGLLTLAELTTTVSPEQAEQDMDVMASTDGAISSPDDVTEDGEAPEPEPTTATADVETETEASATESPGDEIVAVNDDETTTANAVDDVDGSEVLDEDVVMTTELPLTTTESLLLTTNDTEECPDGSVCVEAVLSVDWTVVHGITVIRGCLPLDTGIIAISQGQLEGAGFNVTTCEEDLCNTRPYSAASVIALSYTLVLLFLIQICVCSFS